MAMKGAARVEFDHLMKTLSLTVSTINWPEGLKLHDC